LLARRLLATPATQARSGRTLSIAGHILTKTRNSLDPGNVHLLVSLKQS
ncbi:unnamed protein product, partial [Sphacelaria rigidula]